MAHVARSRTRETSTSTGTGNFTLAGAQPAFQRFWDHMSAGDTCWYTITGPSNTWETGIGTMNAANVLIRTTVLESSNNDALVNFASGTKDVFMDFPGNGQWTNEFIADAAIASRNIVANAVLLSKIQKIGTKTLLGNPTGAEADVSAVDYMGAQFRQDVSDMPLLGRWGGSDLGGLTNIIVTLPAEYRMFRLVEMDLRSTDANASLIIRTSFATSGGMDSGTSDYSNLLFGFSGGDANFSGNYASANWAYVRQITTVSGRSQVEFSDGSWGIQWGMHAFSSAYSSNRDSCVTRVARRNASTGRIARVQFGFNAALVNGGEIRLYAYR